MTFMAQRLPVILIPEQIHVAFVRDDVINLGSRLDSALSLAFGAQRMSYEKSLGRSLPW